VLGGLLAATFLSLYLVPALYTFISRRQRPEAADPRPAAPVSLPDPV
jgi:hypothetical protein